MTESSELKDAAEADLLDATACLYKLGADRACHCWSFFVETSLRGRRQKGREKGLNDRAREKTST